MTNVKSCPFCNSKDIKISFKSMGKYDKENKREKYHVTLYCNKCKATSPRVIANIRLDGCIAFGSIMNPEDKQQAINKAINKWNERK